MAPKKAIKDAKSQKDPEIAKEEELLASLEAEVGLLGRCSQTLRVVFFKCDCSCSFGVGFRMLNVSLYSLPSFDWWVVNQRQQNCVKSL